MKLYWKVKIDGKWTFRAAKAYKQSYGYAVKPYDGNDNNDGKMS